MSSRRAIRKPREPLSNGELPGALDALTVLPRALWSVWRRLLSTYHGPLIRVALASNPSVLQSDIGFNPSTNLLDTPSLQSFVGVESWDIIAVYSQRLGYDVTVTGAGAMAPDGGTSGAIITSGGHPAADFVPANGIKLKYANALDLSGSVALTLWNDFTVDTTNVERIIINMGANSALAYAINSYPDSTHLKFGINGANRIFTATNVTGQKNRVIAQLGAGAQIGTAVMRQNGVALAESSSTNPTSVLTLGTTQTSIGNLITGNGNEHDGKWLEGGVWNAVLGAGDLALIEGLS
jgi:hypothetical protein